MKITLTSPLRKVAGESNSTLELGTNEVQNLNIFITIFSFFKRQVF
jgi:hypothetical protein